MKSALLFFCATKTIHFLIGVPRNGWTEMKHENTSPNGSCIKRRLLPLFGGRQMKSSTATSGTLAKPSQQRSMARNWTKYTKNCNVYVQYWSIEKDLFLSMTTPDRMSLKWLCRNWTNWTTKLYLTQLNHQTSLRPTAIFSSFSTTSYKRRSSRTKQQLETPSKNSLFPGLQNSVLRNRFVSCWQKCIDCNGSHFGE
jgi:hypothetical protein